MWKKICVIGCIAVSSAIIIHIKNQEFEPKTIYNRQVEENEKIDVCREECNSDAQGNSSMTVDELIVVYFAPGDVAYAHEIIACESHYNPRAHNNNPSTGDDSYGLAQINLLHNLFGERLTQARKLGYEGPATRADLGAWLLDPENNIRFFAYLYERHGWSPWACHKKIQAKKI